MNSGNRRNKNLLRLSLALVLVAGTQSISAADVNALDVQAKAITKQFVSTLLPTLQRAMADGGTENAVEVCAVRAPAIATELAAETGWSVKRVSLKPRNMSSAVPDEWEHEVLQQFDQRQAAGESGATINTSAMVNDVYRFMQAQPAMPLCLACHGTDISPKVESVLQRHYPNDAATGYFAGQIRGAISLSKKLP
jgi:hypothetical protein